MNKFQKTGWLALFAAPLLISASSGDEASDATVLSVTGQGYSSQELETMTVRASSSTFSKYAGRAVSDNAAVLDRLRDTLDDKGINRRDISTNGFRFNRTQDPEDNDRDRDWGFEVAQELVVVVRDPDTTGAVLDALVDAGADNINVQNGWTWQAQTSDAVQSEARKAAVADARKKAEDYASALGMRISRVVEVRDGGVHMTGGPAPMARVAADVGTQIDNGERAVVASVNVQFELERK